MPTASSVMNNDELEGLLLIAMGIGVSALVAVARGGGLAHLSSWAVSLIALRFMLVIGAGWLLFWCAWHWSHYDETVRAIAGVDQRRNFKVAQRIDKHLFNSVLLAGMLCAAALFAPWIVNGVRRRLRRP